MGQNVAAWSLSSDLALSTPTTLMALQLRRRLKVAPDPLLQLVACLRLAAKTVADCPSCGTTRRVLRRAYGQNYTRRHISDSELAVFKAVGFQVPLFTIIDLVEFLIEACALPVGLNAKKLLDVSEALLKFTYLLHDNIFSRFRWATGKNIFLRENYDYHQPLLAGSILLSACHLVQETSVSKLKKSLAKETKETAFDISCLTNIIITFALE